MKVITESTTTVPTKIIRVMDDDGCTLDIIELSCYSGYDICVKSLYAGYNDITLPFQGWDRVNREIKKFKAEVKRLCIFEDN